MLCLMCLLLTDNIGSVFLIVDSLLLVSVELADTSARIVERVRLVASWTRRLPRAKVGEDVGVGPMEFKLNSAEYFSRQFLAKSLFVSEHKIRLRFRVPLYTIIGHFRDAVCSQSVMSSSNDA